MILLPEAIGEALLGATWEGAQSVMFPMAFAMAGSGIAIGASIGLRAMLENRRATKARVIISILSVGAAIGGAAIGGAAGAAWGIAVISLLSGAVWWLELNRAIAAGPSTPGAPLTVQGN